MFPLRDTIPSRYPPVMTWALIGLNVLVFLYQAALPEAAVEQLFYLFGMVPARYSDPAWGMSVGLPAYNLWPFLTSMFLHGGFLHLVLNMWTLWIFGDNVEDRMGPFRFLSFYLLCGLLAGAAHWVSSPASTLPVVGASGAIAGVLGAYFFLYPHSRVVTLVPIFFWPLFFELPAYFYLGFWFLSQLMSGSLAGTSEAAGGIAWWAHVGGFAAGLLLYRLFLSRKRLAAMRPTRHFVLGAYGDPSRRPRRPPLSH